MSCLRCFSVAFLLCVFATNVSGLEPPKTGRQWITAGFSLSPGVLHDKNGESRGVTNDSLNVGLGYRFGLWHALTPQFYMAAEAEIGSTYFRPHTAHPLGVSDTDNAISYQLGLMGRYLPFDDDGKLTLGLGLTLFRASLDDAPLQSLSAEARVGWLMWKGFRFTTIELSYGVPVLAGLSLPAFDYDGTDPVDKTWQFHRLGLIFSYGF